jgi:hypothetical protein
MDHLSDDIIGKWTRLGCRAALVGTDGAVDFDSREHLAAFFKIVPEALDSVLNKLPHVVIEERENRHGGLTVTFSKWTHYQLDSTRAERARASRSKRRGDKRRKESPPTPQPARPADPQPPDPNPFPERANGRDASAPVIQSRGPGWECEGCVGLLQLVADAGLPANVSPRLAAQVHQAHGTPDAEAVVRWKLGKFQRGEEPSRFAAPKVLFDADNWPVTVAAYRDALRASHSSDGEGLAADLLGRA